MNGPRILKETRMETIEEITKPGAVFVSSPVPAAACKMGGNCTWDRQHTTFFKMSRLHKYRQLYRGNNIAQLRGSCARVPIESCHRHTLTKSVDFGQEKKILKPSSPRLRFFFFFCHWPRVTAILRALFIIMAALNGAEAAAHYVYSKKASFISW